MKKISGFIFALIFSSYSFMVCAQVSATYEEENVSSPIQAVKPRLICGDDERPIVVSGYMNYPPFGWKEKIGVQSSFGEDKSIYQYYGLGMLLFDKFAKESNLKYATANFLNYDEAKYALSRGYVDVLLGNYFEQKSYSNVNYFYPGYITNPIVIVSLKPKDGEKGPQSWDDLKGKKGFVRAEENLLDLIQTQLPKETQISTVNGARRAFQALLRKEVDFLLMSQLAYETEVRRFKIKEFVSYEKAALFSPTIFFSYASGSPCAQFIKNAFEAKLKEYTSDKQLIDSLMRSQIALWERKFIKEPSLIKQIDMVIEEEKEEETSDLDAWLAQQAKAKEGSREKSQTSVGI
ncbi:MAG: transporter substrate-binding domain-containing protein [Alphaproteobacteria bacterium]|nr:transporter substrate-binding domain-containing protein [Alphaproteobacteria bacterium]